MKEIEVGEYVRTKNQSIKRIDTILKNKTVNKYGYEIGSEWDGKLYSTIKTTDIVKHSKNIIDLIEVGDYVNGKEVHKYNGNTGIVSINELGWTFIAFKDKKYPIETIVTREQFASMEYKVGE